MQLLVNGAFEKLRLFRTTENLQIHSTSGTVESGVDLVLGEFAADTTSGALLLSSIEASAMELITTSGEVRGDELHAERMTMKSTSGTLACTGISAQDITVETTSADVTLQNVRGHISYHTTSGMLTATELDGSGTFEARSSGGIELSYVRIGGDLSAVTRDGALSLQVPAAFSFELIAVTREGRIDTPYIHLALSENALGGAIGEQPAYTVRLETRDGAIQVSQP